MALLLIALSFFFLQLRKNKKLLNLQNRKIEEQNNQLKEMDKIKTNFFSNITHELRTPLTLIIEPLRQSLKQVKDLSLLENLTFAKNNSEKLLFLVNQLLDVSKLEAGKMDLDLRFSDVKSILTPIVDSFKPLAEEKQIELKIKIKKDLEDFYLDKPNLEKIIYNLISNAIKFTERGIVEVILSKEIITETKNLKTGQYLVLEIADTGIGIPELQHKNIFVRFHQVNNAKNAHGGTGIGLSLVRELVELMQGAIFVQSAEGRGSTFKVLIPMFLQLSHPSIAMEIEDMDLSSETNHVPATAMTPILNKPSEGSEVILVIEDNLELRTFINRSLQDKYQILEASDGEKGIQVALDQIPDLIITDVMMPKKDGYEVLRFLKNEMTTSHIPIILLTAKSSIESKLDGLRGKADIFMNKPFNTEELILQISNLIETRKLSQEKFNNKSLVQADQLNHLSHLDKEFINKITTLIEIHIKDKELTVEFLASKIFMSRSQLFRKIKAITSFTPNELIRNQRLDRGMELVQSNSGNTSQIAMEVGFTDEKYFSKRFKERFGISPKQGFESKT